MTDSHPERSAGEREDELDAKLAALRSILLNLGSVVVAYSGGVDSTFLLRVVTDTQGLEHLAVTTDSPTNTAEEIEQARELARAFGARHLVVAVNELDTPGYAENPAHRCYLCKQTLYPLCLRTARKQGMGHVIDGVNVDDLGDYRPGLDAARELKIRHPLVEAGLTKRDVRDLSARFSLPTAEMPASPCLSSRFPYGTRITPERLEQVARAEAAVRRLGFVELRVRHLGEGARVEIAAAEISRLDEHDMMRRIEVAVRGVGFGSVDVSRRPLRSGSLNDAVLSENDRRRTGAQGSDPPPS